MRELDSSEEAMRLRMAQQMPLRFGALVVENTNRCNAKCGMCYQEAGPKGADTLGRADLSESTIVDVLERARDIPNLVPRFHLSGGEAFLTMSQCFRIFRAAATAGYEDITTTTNAFWAKKLQRAVDVAQELRRCGVTSMEISWDYWHLDYIPPVAVENCLVAAHQAGIETNLRVLATNNHPYREALSLLKAPALNLAHRVTCGPVFHTGRARREIDSDEILSAGRLDDNCHSVLNLTVNAHGNVYPCCAGLDQTNLLIFGNVWKQDIRDIADELGRSALVRTVVFRGISALLPILRSHGVPTPERPRSICEMCSQIFSNPRAVKCLVKYFDNLERDAIQKVIASRLAVESSGGRDA